MVDNISRISEIKRKVRKLKKLELKIRFNNIKPNKTLVWDIFFNIQETNSNAKYSLNYLLSINRDEYKTIIDDFFSYVYYELYKENGLVNAYGLYEPLLLKKLGLSLDANEHDIKKRFRELANKHHPDKGGDAKMFIELMDNYRNLIDK